MELFANSYNPSAYEIMREHLDYELDIIKAMHAYEMISIAQENMKELIDIDERVKDEVMLEGQNLDATKIRNEHIKEAAAVGKEAKKLAKAGEYDKAKAKYKEAADLMREGAAKIRKTKGEWGSYFLGSGAGLLKMSIAVATSSIPVLNLVTLALEFKILFDFLKGQEKHNKLSKSEKGRNADITSGNMYVLKVIDVCEKTAKLYDKLADGCDKKKAKSVKESYGEFDEESVVLEAAGDVLERIKIAAKTFFEKIKGWIKATIDSFTTNAGALRKFAKKHASVINSLSGSFTITPEGYSLYPYYHIGDLKDLFIVSPRKLKDLDSMVEKAVDGDASAIEELKRNAHITQGEFMKDLFGINGITVNNVPSGDSDNMSFYHGYLDGYFRGSDKTVDKVDGKKIKEFHKFIDHQYPKMITGFTNAYRELDAAHKAFDAHMSKMMRKLKSDGKASDSIVSHLNMYWAVVKRQKNAQFQFMNWMRSICTEIAGVSRRVIAQAVKESNKN